MNKQHSVEQKLIQALLKGRWKLFERLPAERQLAGEFGVNRATLRAAIIALAARGILETRHGSGTVVRSIPAGNARDEGVREKLEACLLLVPPIMKACSLKMRPSHLLALERLFPAAGAALRSSDMPAFIQSQMQFFSDAAQVVGSSSVDAALAVCLPDGKSLLHLVEPCGLAEREATFARFAGILNALRHSDAEETMTATAAYFSHFMNLLEEA